MSISFKHMHVYSYLLCRFKLVGIVVYVKDIDSYNWNIPIIVAPMYDASWQCNNISLFEAVNFLVLILELLALALTLSKLFLTKWLELLLKSRWASGESQPCETPTCDKTCILITHG